ncbi:MAG: carbohydrate binding family 9 domain-containing protein [Gemmatimonadota bacterium]|nr:carbohydrate binding family 9 domain-containing protein [Gemmatimonadota bacterium]
MLVTFLLATALLQDSTLVYSGRANRTRVDVPRIESVATIDGNLDDPVWRRAARLAGFSQYQPVDGRPAEEPTEVLVWYSPEAIYFGIRAREIHGNVVRATHANRDNIDSEDQIQILLDTDNARQIAFLFGVNPYGVQQDGTRSAQFAGGAGGASATGGGFRTMNPLEGSVDLNPDYFFESKGRLVEGGYEVEVRIPFKSLRYQDARVQSWGLHILRRVQHSGFQDTWAPAVRANANFLAQSGSLDGLHDLKRGLVLEATPTVTAHADRSPTINNGNYQRKADLGGDARWGIRQNLTLNGTINPDFSQVEADVGQVLLNERFALFYPEKRPFFLDGLELFDSPNQLIYTRQIVAPLGGVKLTGKLGRTNVASMVVGDDRQYSWGGNHSPLFGVSRIRYDYGSSNTLGAVLTTREDGDSHSRIAAGDIRFYHSKLYFAQFQAGRSWTDSLGNRRNGSLYQADWDRTGRAWGFHYTLKSLDPGFKAAAGFVNRTGIIGANAFNRLSFYGAPGALVQTYGSFFFVTQIWNNVGGGHGLAESNMSISPTATIRGGWQLSGAVTHNYFAFDPLLYSGLMIQRSLGALTDTAAFVVPGPEKDQWGGSFRVTTPTYRHFSGTASITENQVPIFREAAPGNSSRIDAALDVRPTTAIRSSLSFSRLTIARKSDGSRFSSETIPRIKVEYQVSPPIFLRVVGQYAARSRAPLEDRNGNPILVNGVLDGGSTTNEFSTDWLFSYRPVPGTLVYLGYGSTLEEPREFRFQDLRRTRDGFFGKISYLFRL